MITGDAQLRTLTEQPPLSALLRFEHALLSACLKSSVAGSALMIECPGLARLGSHRHAVVRLRLASGGKLSGDVGCRVEALPFDDNSIDLVVLRHACELGETPELLVREAGRVLARGGIMLVTGLHPCSLWHLWMSRQSRALQVGYRACMPWRLAGWLRAGAMRVDQHSRFGGSLPRADWNALGGRGPLAGGYLLRASKPSSAVTPIRLARTRPVPAVINTSLAGTARRQTG